MSGIVAHDDLMKELKARNLHLDPGEIAAIEVAALVNTLKVYRAGIVHLLRNRYVRGDRYFSQYVSVKNPRGSKALHKTKKHGTVYKNIVGGRVRVQGPKKVNIKEWELSYAPKGLAVTVLRGKPEQEIRASFLGHGHGGRIMAFRRTGKFYLTDKGWIREHITPVRTTSGLEILQQHAKKLESLSLLQEDVGLYMRRSVLGQLDRMLAAKARKRR